MGVKTAFLRRASSGGGLRRYQCIPVEVYRSDHFRCPGWYRRFCVYDSIRDKWPEKVLWAGGESGEGPGRCEP